MREFDLVNHFMLQHASEYSYIGTLTCNRQTLQETITNIVSFYYLLFV